MAALPQAAPEPPPRRHAVSPAGSDPTSQARGIVYGMTIGAVMWGMVVLALLVARQAA